MGCGEGGGVEWRGVSEWTKKEVDGSEKLQLSYYSWVTAIKKKCLTAKVCEAQWLNDVHARLGKGLTHRKSNVK